MVRADDLGFSKAINYGIYETVKNGVIRNIGFMVNMPDSLHGYELVKDYDICLGNIQMYVWENLFVILNHRLLPLFFSCCTSQEKAKQKLFRQIGRAHV